MTKTHLLRLTSIVFCFSLFIVATFLPQSVSAKTNQKYASLVMDADTGMILQQRYADKKLHPASLTKIMTLLMVFEALESGKISLKERIRISNHAASMPPSKFDLPAGSSIRVKDAIYALVTKSANDVAVAIGEHLAGSERNFARKMTYRAQQLGMENTRFMNASGLHHPRQISTARDMAKLARIVIVNYPTYYRYFSRASFTYRGKTYNNHNKLLGTYPGMDGMKTGYINASGFNLVASAIRDNRRIIGVVFGGRTSKTRNAHMAQLLDQGFKKIGRVRYARHITPTPGKKPITTAALNNEYMKQGRLIAVRQTSSNAYRLSAYENPNEQGDSSPYATRRLETGLLAIAAHKAANNISRKTLTDPTYALEHNMPKSNNGLNGDQWSIQVGAYSSRARSDQAATLAHQRLPSHLAHATPRIAPLKTGENWVFRARLNGFTKSQAFEACSYVSGCMAIAP